MDNRSLRKIINSAYRGLRDRISVKCETVGLKMDITDMESSPLKADIQTRRQFLEWKEIYSNNGYYDILTVIEFTSRWFYRFVALRYMEVNGFLASGIRVLSNAQGEFKPEILTKLDELDLPGLDPEMVSANRKKKNSCIAIFCLHSVEHCTKFFQSFSKKKMIFQNCFCQMIF